MENLVTGIIWVCITWMVHDVTTGAAKVINTLFVERYRVQIEEAQARRIEAQALIIADRERQRRNIKERWDTV